VNGRARPRWLPARVQTAVLLWGIVLTSVAHAQMPAPTSLDSGPRVQAYPTSDPITLDGRLDEPVWARENPATGFRQIDPEFDAPARFATDVRVAYDAEHLYVAFVAHDSDGRNGLRVQDLRRKFDYFQNDLVGMSLDPLGDGHNAYAFQLTPRGNLRDLHVLDGLYYNRQWQAVWQARTSVGDEGWTAEVAIPWTSLRYAAGTTRMRVNFYRISRRENELSGWVPWPRTQNPYRMDYAGWIEGLAPPPPSAAVWARPYAATASQRTTGDGRVGHDVGGELLWQPSPNTIVEGTVNTDFAQADVDRQVVNLRRFSYFFPEQRQFFLDTATLFDVGTSDDLVIRPFFSRRVGLSESGTAIPLTGGVRAVRASTQGTSGVMAMHQRAGTQSDAATFLIGRTSRNFGGARRLGGLFVTRRDAGAEASAATATAAIDGFVRFTPTLTAEGMVSGTRTGPGVSGLAGYARIARETNQFTAALLEAVVTRDYAPSAGFVSRTNVAMHAPYLSYDYRPSWRPTAVRNFKFVAYSYLYTSLEDGALEEGYTEAWVDVSGQRGGLFYADLQHFSQRVTTPFEPVPGVVIPAGRYSYVRPNLYYGSDRSRRVWYAARAYTGGFYDRSLDQIELQAFVSPSPRVALGLRADLNRFRGAGSGATTRLIAPELRLAWTPRVQLTTFYQYNDAVRQGVLNARFSWEYRPLSYLYVVLNDARGVGSQAALAPQRQQLLVKLVYFGHL